MRRETRDELLLGFLAINAMLREEVLDLRRSLRARASEAKYNPNWAKQPRAPKGTSEGGQWIEGGGKVRILAQPQPRERSGPQPQERPERQPTQRPPNAANDNESRRSPRARFGPTASVMTGAAVLELVDSANERARIINTINRFHLDRNAADDVLAARAHVWATQIAPSVLSEPFDEIPFSGPVNERVALALLRYEQAHPGTLGLAEEGDENAQNTVRAVVRAALDGRDAAHIVSANETPRVVPLLPEERTLDFNLRQRGAAQAHINLAIEQLRNSEAESESFVAALRASGARRDQIRATVAAVREARRNRPYTPPSAGPLVDIFPELPTASGTTKVFASEVELYAQPPYAQSERESRRVADALLAEMRAVDPLFISPALNDPNLFPTTIEGRVAYISTLRAEHAAALFRARGEVQPLQVATLHFAQQQTDAAYIDAVRLYEAGELEGLNRQNAIGSYVDETVRRQLRAFYVNIGLRESDILRVNRNEYISRRRFRRPDARVADIFFDMSLEDKSVGGKQIVGFFESETAPTYVIIIRLRQVGRTFLITPPRSRYSRR